VYRGFVSVFRLRPLWIGSLLSVCTSLFGCIWVCSECLRLYRGLRVSRLRSLWIGSLDGVYTSLFVCIYISFWVYIHLFLGVYRSLLSV